MSNVCQKRRDAQGWLTCHRCGSQWHESILGDWMPLSCVDRPQHKLWKPENACMACDKPIINGELCDSCAEDAARSAGACYCDLPDEACRAAGHYGTAAGAGR